MAQGEGHWKANEFFEVPMAGLVLLTGQCPGRQGTCFFQHSDNVTVYFFNMFQVLHVAYTWEQSSQFLQVWFIILKFNLKKKS